MLNKWDMFTLGAAAASLLGTKLAEKLGGIAETSSEALKKLPIVFYEGKGGFQAGYIPGTGYRILVPFSKNLSFPIGPIMHEYAHLDSKWQRQWLKAINTNPWAGIVANMGHPKMGLLHTIAGALVPGNLGYAVALLPQLPTLAAETQANLKVLKWALQGKHKLFGQLTKKQRLAAIATAIGSLLNYWGAAAATVGGVYGTKKLLEKLQEELKNSPKTRRESR